MLQHTTNWPTSQTTSSNTATLYQVHVHKYINTYVYKQNLTSITTWHDTWTSLLTIRMFVLNKKIGIDIPLIPLTNKW